jgi:hypothetical protein
MPHRIGGPHNSVSLVHFENLPVHSKVPLDNYLLWPFCACGTVERRSSYERGKRSEGYKLANHIP